MTELKNMFILKYKVMVNLFKISIVKWEKQLIDNKDYSYLFKSDKRYEFNYLLFKILLQKLSI